MGQRSRTNEPHTFRAHEALLDIRRLKALRQAKSYQTSPLQKYRAELVGLRQAGASYGELALWLAHEQQMSVTRSQVRHYLAKLPELRKVEDAELS